MFGGGLEVRAEVRATDSDSAAEGLGGGEGSGLQFFRGRGLCPYHRAQLTWGSLKSRSVIGGCCA